MSKPKRPNRKLQHEREIRGWSQQKVAAEIDTDEKRMGIWERGESTPSPYYRQKLCQLFGKNAQELGFLDAAAHDDSHRESVHIQPVNPADIFSDGNTLIEEREVIAAGNITPDQQSGVWLALSTQNLAPLFAEGWTPQMVLEVLHVLLPGVHAMSQISRRTFGQQMLQLGASAFFSGVSLPAGKHVSAEEKMRLCQTLGESIAAGWKLFHTANNAQVLAVGQAQLSLLQHVGPLLPAREQALFYSPVYRLIGGALHFQGRYDEALDAHHKAYLAALEGMDVWNMAQNRMWQASGLKGQGKYAEALQTIEAALRLTSMQSDLESIRTTAHLLASGAEIAALMGDEKEVQSKLSASEQWLEYLPGQHEEYDRAAWYEIAGVCSLHLKHYDLAVKQLKQAIETLPPQSVLRHITAFMPLVMAYANVGEPDLSFSTAEQALPLLRAINAPDMNRQFVQYTACALSGAFPHDKSIHTFLVDIQHQLLSQHTLTIIE